MSLKLLAVGDLHLGRRPSRLPNALAGQAHALGPAGAWKRVVDQAVECSVDAVALAGDVVERDDDFFEGYRELSDGVSKLTEASIRVLGVVGNHDVKVLPRLAEHIPDFELIGRGGQWESVALEAAGERLTLWGWSFPREPVRQSPLEGMVFERGVEPNLGLLHCDLDQADSVYAPVRSEELNAADLDGWLLGHIHQPSALDTGRPQGYLGSVTGMDPGEVGARGPWLVTVEGGQIVQTVQWVLAPLRWERVDLDLTGLETPDQVRDRLLENLKDLDAGLAELESPPDAVGLRMRLVGRTQLGEHALEVFGEDDREHVFDGQGGTHYFIEKLIAETRPEIALDDLAERNDPAGLLARRLRVLDDVEEDAERKKLIGEGRRRLQSRLAEARWSGLELDPLQDEQVVEYLRRAGTRLLERMLAQQEGA